MMLHSRMHHWLSMNLKMMSQALIDDSNRRGWTAAMAAAAALFCCTLHEVVAAYHPGRWSAMHVCRI